ncbi:MAG: hypothetical protein IPM46_01600 [Flavobacteriales bacterium]|nr:hypothetical protein [Flavobacteriales bacterium]
MLGVVLHKGLLPAAKRALRILAATTVLVVLQAADAKGQDLVQAAVDGLTDPLTAREASLLVQQHQGVIMARFDVSTRNMMLHVHPTCVLDAATLNAQLLPLGIQVRCLTRRDARAAPFRHIDPTRCGDQPAPAR